jgi:thiosulfate reductase cytochrome b subunit
VSCEGPDLWTTEKLLPPGQLQCHEKNCKVKICKHFFQHCVRQRGPLRILSNFQSLMKTRQFPWLFHCLDEIIHKIHQLALFEVILFSLRNLLMTGLGCLKPQEFSGVIKFFNLIYSLLHTTDYWASVNKSFMSVMVNLVVNLIGLRVG